MSTEPTHGRVHVCQAFRPGHINACQVGYVFGFAMLCAILGATADRLPACTPLRAELGGCI
jgi:hypothetical protein